MSIINKYIIYIYIYIFAKPLFFQNFTSDDLKFFGLKTAKVDPYGND